MKIAMVGSGYVGLVSGACFADFGHEVVCIDKDPSKIERLNAGAMPIYEPGLSELVAGNVKAGRLSFTTNLSEGIAGAGAIFIAVGTPSRRSAELIKYAANAFLATKITFINEIADLCEQVGGDVQDVARGIGLDGRIGGKFLHAGPGYGGSCFPKDTLALLKTAEDYDSPTRIVEAVVKANDSRKRAMGRKVIEAIVSATGQKSVRGRRVALLGLTFKPNTDDMRDAPSLAIAQALIDAGIEVVAYDPEGMELAAPLMPGVTMAESAYAAIEGADAVAIVTEWDAFRALDLKRIKELARTPVLADLRNIYDPAEVRSHGFTYVSIGRV